MADSEADVVADYGASRRDKHYEQQVKFTRGGKVTGNQENRFAGHRHACILKHYPEENGPIAINEHVVLNQLQRVVQEFHLCGACSGSNVARLLGF